MIGLILLVFTWLLLRLNGERLSAIGLDQWRRRLTEFGAGFGLLGSAAALQQLGLSAVTGDRFVLNAQLSMPGLLDAIRSVSNSVLFEEFVFRGYLLYLGVRWLGMRRAVLLDAAAFGVYHWFSYGVLGNPVVMAYVFVMTGAYGLMWARAFTASGSIVAPLGMHLGWNFVSYIVFSAGPFGAVLLVPAGGARQLRASGWADVALTIAWPLIVAAVVLWLCRWYEHRKHCVQTREGNLG